MWASPPLSERCCSVCFFLLLLLLLLLLFFLRDHTFSDRLLLYTVRVCVHVRRQHPSSSNDVTSIFFFYSRWLLFLTDEWLNLIAELVWSHSSLFFVLSFFFRTMCQVSLARALFEHFTRWQWEKNDEVNRLYPQRLDESRYWAERKSNCLFLSFSLPGFDDDIVHSCYFDKSLKISFGCLYCSMLDRTCFSPPVMTRSIFLSFYLSLSLSSDIYHHATSIAWHPLPFSSMRSCGWDQRRYWS